MITYFTRVYPEITELVALLMSGVLKTATDCQITGPVLCGSCLFGLDFKDLNKVMPQCVNAKLVT